jgi:small subunit ribosomal protein S2
MPMPTLTQLLEAGAHFGHKKERSFPRAKKFTYTIRDSVYVIDLEKTIQNLKAAIEYLQKLIGADKIILFLGTKRQAREAIKKTAEKLNQPYVVERWLGGMLTNFETIHKSLKQLEKLEELQKSEEFSKYTKKERQRTQEKIKKTLSIFSGIRNMNKLPDALFIVDTAKENVAVLEARRMNIPIVGICDTNANPDLIDYPIPANDDSEKTIQLIMTKLEEELKTKDIKKDNKKEKKE